MKILVSCQKLARSCPTAKWLLAALRVFQGVGSAFLFLKRREAQPRLCAQDLTRCPCRPKPGDTTCHEVRAPHRAPSCFAQPGTGSGWSKRGSSSSFSKIRLVMPSAGGQPVCAERGHAHWPQKGPAALLEAPSQGRGPCALFPWSFWLPRGGMGAAQGGRGGCT